ncbi:MAG TPA: BamA/TamA family outer membrane protein [Chitinophagales bacterium]|nr:BamA/TamA family outer membrane protein [Chitinophagales bacterium]
MKHLFPIVLVMIIAMLLCGCTGTHHLAEGEKLYTGASVKFVKQGDITKTKTLSGEVQKVITPKPNGTLLGISRPKLWFYQIAGTPTGKGFRYFLKNTLGEPPVLLSKVSPPSTSSLIKNRLENDGYFYSTVSYEVKEKKRTARVIYTATLHTPYRIDSISFPEQTDTIDVKILQTKSKTLIRKGDIYNLYTLKTERDRIDLELKNQGYFYFNADDLVFYADTAVGGHKVHLFLEVKVDAPYKALQRYRMHKIVINPNYSLGQDSVQVRADTILMEGKYYVNSDSTLKPKNIVRSVFLDPGEYYTRKDHDNTLRRLMGVGIFKFANIRFEDFEVRDTSFLNATINLTQLYKKSLRAEILGISKSTNFAGPAFDVSFRNRNFLKGSELLVLNAQAGFETQISGKIPGQPALGSFNVSAAAKLYVPKFIVPFYKVNTVSSFYVPKTKFEISGEQIYHLQYFTLNSFTFNYGYNWKASAFKEHELDPVVINYVSIFNTTPLFDSLLDQNPFLRKNFEQQFILGLIYSYTFNNQTQLFKRNQFYFKGTADFSGNLASLINGLITGVKVNSENPQLIFGSPYSQYSRFDIDGRYYRVFPKLNKIATRLIAGVGFPYGNSDALPYIKQFFIGGSNSIRAFRARTLGPGSYPPPSIDSITFLEQAGDIKLEVNGEYRFNLVSIIKGAVFVDAGNIWLLHDDPLRPGGLFQINTFWTQMAVGTGFGLRADASFFVVRADFAFPIRKPWLAPADRWVFNQIDFGNAQWAKENLVLNIAIGYPF